MDPGDDLWLLSSVTRTAPGILALRLLIGFGELVDEDHFEHIDKKAKLAYLTKQYSNTGFAARFHAARITHDLQQIATKPVFAARASILLRAMVSQVDYENLGTGAKQVYDLAISCHIALEKAANGKGHPMRRAIATMMETIRKDFYASLDALVRKIENEKLLALLGVQGQVSQLSLSALTSMMSAENDPNYKADHCGFFVTRSGKSFIRTLTGVSVSVHSFITHSSSPFPHLPILFLAFLACA